MWYLMKKIQTRQITQKVSQALKGANLYLPPEIKNLFLKKFREARSVKEKNLWQLLIKNFGLAQKNSLPLCQDTGLVIAFVELGNKVLVEGGTVTQAINAGVKEAYQKNYFRKSVVNDPIIRKNTGTNGPASVYLETAPGAKIKISLLIKGAGAENQSVIKMFSPSASLDEIKKFVLDTVKLGGPFACPPLFIGLGLGGTFESVGLLAKKALLRKIGTQNKNSKLAALEKEILSTSNRLKIGLFGLKIGPTALAVHIETAPSHIASLPVAVNLQCHALRKATIVL